LDQVKKEKEEKEIELQNKYLSRFKKSKTYKKKLIIDKELIVDKTKTYKKK
jgi:hypothetical protein